MAAFDIDPTVINAMLDAFESTIGTGATLRIRSGAKPTNTGSADSGTVLATISLPSDWMAAASGGSKGIAGTWQDSAADAAGTAGHFRIYDSGGTCRAQGSITATGGGGAMELDNTVLAVGQQFTVTAFSLTGAGL